MNKFKNFERKINSFIIYADFESILLPEVYWKQNPMKPYTKKYQKHVVFSDGYKLICVGDKFSKSSKSYLGKDAVTVSLAVWSMKVSIVAM